jgi:hypothetical protein
VCRNCYVQNSDVSIFKEIWDKEIWDRRTSPFDWREPGDSET